MAQPNQQQWRKSRPNGLRIGAVDKLFHALRVLDRTVVEISMHMYKVPRRDRAAVLKQHRRLHDTIRENLTR